MNIHNGYFSIKNPLLLIDEWLHPYRYQSTIDYEGKSLTIKWTQRAQQELDNRTSPLVIEMQVYFSCVVQKRVLFHDDTEFPVTKVNDKLQLVLRPVEASSCDPVEFAKNHPVAREYTSTAARSFRATKLELDFKNQQWQAEFYI